MSSLRSMSETSDGQMKALKWVTNRRATGWRNAEAARLVSQHDDDGTWLQTEQTTRTWPRPGGEILQRRDQEHSGKVRRLEPRW